MQYRKLGNSSLEVSVLGLGALHLGVFCNQEESTRLILSALDSGVNFIDTAPMYGNGNSESFVKNAIKGRRKEVLIGTKVGLEPLFSADGVFGVKVVALKKETIRQSLVKSLANIGTDYIDLYQVHAFDASTPMDETLKALDDLVREGKVRFVGCSNYEAKELKYYSSIADKGNFLHFVSLQCQYNLIERRAELEIVPACLEQDCSIICYRALCRGILSGKYKYNQSLPRGSRAQTSNRVRRLLSKDTLTLTQALEDFAVAHGHTLSELAIAWLMARPAVSSVLVGMRNIEQVENCCRATNWQLRKKEIAEIDRIIASLNLTEQVNALPETFLEK